MSDPTPPTADHAPAKSGGGGMSGKIVLAVAGLNLLATTGLAAVVVLRSPSAPVAEHAEHGEAKAEAKPAEHGEAAKPAEHGEAKAEAKPAEHGEAAKPAEGGHGEAPKPAEGGEHGAAPAAGAAAAGTPSSAMNTARLEDIVVHLRNPEVDRYARLTIDVEMQNADEVKNLQDNVPRVRDAVIMTLSEHTFEELRGGEGLARMKSWLREAIDDVVPGRVTNVYVSTFLVQ